MSVVQGLGLGILAISPELPRKPVYRPDELILKSVNMFKKIVKSQETLLIRSILVNRVPKTQLGLTNPVINY